MQSPRLVSQNSGNDSDGMSSPVASKLVRFGDPEASPETMERKNRSRGIRKRLSYLQDYVHYVW